MWWSKMGSLGFATAYNVRLKFSLRAARIRIDLRS